MHRRQDFDRPPAGRACPARRPGKGSGAAALVLAFGVLLASGAAWGDCVQNGITVTCSPPGDGGFDAAGQDDLTVTIEAGAEVAASLPDSRGISIENNSTVTIRQGTDTPVVADGRIEVSADGAIGVWGRDGNTVENFGTITGIGADATGIVLAGDAGLVDNRGEITLTGDDAIGIKVGAGATVLNWQQGEITVSGENAIGIEITDGQRVENLRSIVVNGTGGVGVLARGSGNNINNSYGTIEATGVGGIAVSLGVGGGTDNRLKNFGTVIGSSVSGPAVSFEGSGTAGDPNEVLNFGIITAEGGTALRGSDGVEVVINEGGITGNVLLEGGDDEFAWSPGSGVDGDIDGGAGTDTFKLSGSDTSGPGAFDLSMASKFEVVEIDTPWVWFLSAPDGYAGDLRVAGGYIRLDTDLDLGGDYTQGDNTGLVVVFTANGPRGVLRVDGDVSIDSGTTLVLREDGEFLESGTYGVLAWSGTRSGEFEEELVLWDTALLQVEVAYDDGSVPGELAVVLTRNTYESTVVGSNRKAVASYLDASVPLLPTGDYTDFENMLGALDGLSQPELQLAMTELSPEVYDAHTSSALSWGRGFTSVLQRRPLRCQSHVYQGLPDIRSESPCGETGWMPWAEPLGQYGKRDGGLNYVSYDRLGAGLAVGADRRLDERWTVSAGLAAGRIGVDFGDLGNGTLTTFDLAVAGSLLFGPAHVRAVASYGHGWHSTRRDLGFLGVRATGDHDSNRLGLLLEAGYEFELGPIRIEPLVEFDYNYIAEPKVAEDGAGASSLRVDERSNSLVATAAGLRVSGTYYKYAYLGSWFEWLDGVITPELSARWRRVWTGDDRPLEAFMVGAPPEAGSFEVVADDASAGLEIGTRVTFQPQWTRNTVELGYDVFIGNNTTVHNLGAKLRIPF